MSSQGVEASLPSSENLIHTGAMIIGFNSTETQTLQSESGKMDLQYVLNDASLQVSCLEGINNRTLLELSKKTKY